MDMVEKKEVNGVVAYTLGIVSIVLAFFSSIAGLTFGIIGFVKSRKDHSELAKTAKKMNLIGIILSLIVFAIQVAILYTKLIKIIPGLTA